MGWPLSTQRRLAWLLLLGYSSLATGSLESARSSRVDASASAPQGPVSPRRAASPPSALPKKVEFPLAKTGERDLPSDTTHAYGIDLKEGQVLRVTFEQQGIDIRVIVFDPANLPVVEVDAFSGSLGPERVVVVAGSSGNHRLEVSRFGSAVPEGRYSIPSLTVRRAAGLDRLCLRAAQEYGIGASLVRSEKDLALGEHHLLRAKDLANKCGSTSGQGDSLIYLARARSLGHDYRSALALSLEANRLFQTTGDGPRQAFTLLNAGFASGWLGDRDRALTFYRATIALANRVANQLETRGPRARARLLEVRRWEVLGRLYLAMATDPVADYSANLVSLQRALDLARARDDEGSEAMILATLGASYLELGDPDRAFELEREANVILSRVSPDPDWKLRIQETLARISVAVDLPERAARSYQDLLGRYGPPGGEANRARILAHLSVALYRLASFEEGLATAERARKLYANLGDRLGEASVLANEAWFLIRLERFDQARQVIREVTSLDAISKGSKAEAGLHFALAELERSQSNLGAAQAQIERVLAILEGIGAQLPEPAERSHLRASLSDPYDFWIELLMQREALESGKGWGLRAFAESDRIRGKGIREAFHRRYKSPLGDQSVGPEQAEALRKLIDDQTVLLQYHLAEAEGYLWIVTREGVRGARLPGRVQLESKAEAFRAALAESDQLGLLEEARRAGNELSQILIQPAALELAAKRKVLVAVPPALEYIPFGVIPLSAASQSRGPWPVSLSSGHEVVTIPSLSAVVTARTALSKQPSAPRSLAIIDDPVTDRGDSRFLDAERNALKRGVGEAKPTRGTLLRLKHAQAQAQGVIDLSGDKNVFRLTSFRARRDSFLRAPLADFRHILFITHGVWKKGDPNGAYLVLSLFDQAGNPLNGFLSSSDIEKLGLRCELVVLSACSSGLGKKVWGEGLAGLSQAFLKAGAKRVVVSLWEVDDEATAELMRRFYHCIFERRLTPAAALREAQESLRHEPRWSSPYYWGGFVLKGDWT